MPDPTEHPDENSESNKQESRDLLEAFYSLDDSLSEEDTDHLIDETEKLLQMGGDALDESFRTFCFPETLCRSSTF